MTKIEIKNVGPITYVNFDLNKVNILMGPQSSGKSTIAKIVSFCQWAEKRYLLDGNFEYNVFEQLLEFHRLSENYFSENSYFSYSSDFITISYKGKKLRKTFRKKNTDKVYRKSKNIYIPSERNFVSVIPNLSKYKETNDNIMSFVYDWFSAKRIFNNNTNALSVLNLDVKFYNKSESDIDILVLKNKKEIHLREGSSGLQSVIPLIVLIEYLTDYIYTRELSNSVEEKDALKNFLLKNLTRLIDFSKYSDQIDEIKNIELDNEDLKKVFNSYQRAKALEQYHLTNFIIEEPEQNLFPTTQRDLVNYLFNKVNNSPHSLLITTHSPYVLYSINNCLMGFNVRKNVDDLDDLVSRKSWIDPDLVSIWQVNSGELFPVKDSKTKTVSKHYFNEITKDIMDEYFEMLSLFEYDSKN